MKYGATGHEDVGAGPDDHGGVLHGHTAVDLDEGRKAAVVDHSAQVADLLAGVGDEFLAAEAGVDAHDEDGVDVLEDIAEEFDGGMGVEGDAGFHAEGVDLLEVAVEMATGFEVNSKAIGTGFPECFGITFGFFDHEMDVEDLVGCFAKLFDDGEAVADVGDEAAIHDVEVEPFGVAVVEHFAFIFEPEKIRGQQRRRYDRHCWSVLCGLKIWIYVAAIAVF